MSKNDRWDIIFQGDLIAIERLQSKGYERAVRPPGVRLILKNADNKFLITKEHRLEHDAFDYRLPGGKVFDDLVSYLEKRSDDTLLRESVLEAAKIEAKEEAGIEKISELKIEQISKAGATIDWTLYYVSGNIEKIGKQELKDDELDHGIEILFLSKEEIHVLIKKGIMKEERSAGVLMSYLDNF